MAENIVKRRPDGKWELISDKSQLFAANTQEEAERLAKAYLAKIAGGAVASGRVARVDRNKAKTSLLSKDD